jgi:hypothetical protein
VKSTTTPKEQAVCNGQEETFPVPEPYACGGLTKREHFAAIALQGLLSSGPPSNVHDEEDARRAALTFGVTAVAMADALLLALEVTPEGV